MKIVCPNLYSNLAKFQLSTVLLSRLLFKNVFLRYRSLKVTGPDFRTILAINPSKISEIGRIRTTLTQNLVCPMEIHTKTCIRRSKRAKWAQNGYFTAILSYIFILISIGKTQILV